MTEQPPWWHETPEQPPVDSVLEEGMKLFAVLKDWAVESGAIEAVTELTTTVATSAGAYLNQAETAADPVAEPQAAEPVHTRCSDCPVCRALDALDAANPDLARTARSALGQVNGLIAGLLRG
jgi:hypothetical protein